MGCSITSATLTLGAGILRLSLRSLFASAESEDAGEGQGEYPDVLMLLFHG